MNSGGLLLKGITPDATWANPKTRHKKKRNLDLILYRGGQHPNPSLHQRARASVARGTGSGSPEVTPKERPFSLEKRRREGSGDISD
jgi:hypothetical protein